MIARLMALGVLGIVVASSPLIAHYSWPVDTSREITVKGTVTGYNVMIGLDVQANGKMEKGDVGGPSTTRMAGNGWGKETLKPGDVITAMGFQFTDGPKILRLQEIVMASGKETFLYGRQ